VREFRVSGPVAALSPAGDVVAYGFRDGTVRLLDLRSGRVVSADGRHEGPVTTMRFSADGRQLVTADATSDCSYGTRRRKPGSRRAHSGGSLALTFSADGRWLASGGGDNLVRLWDARRRASVDSVVRRVADLSLNKDGTVLAATLFEENFRGGLELYSVPDLELIRTVRAPVAPSAGSRRTDAG
jgi:WD40 repeat protein